jgi:hypothetical protein
MLFEKSFVDNYVYKKDNKNIIITGGYPVNDLFEKNDKDLDAKFENMAIPIGLVIEKTKKVNYGGEKHFNKYQNSEHELIDNDMFDHLIESVSYGKKHNKTKKLKVDSNNKTKKYNNSI